MVHQLPITRTPSSILLFQVLITYSWESVAKSHITKLDNVSVLHCHIIYQALIITIVGIGVIVSNQLKYHRNDEACTSYEKEKCKVKRA